MPPFLILDECFWGRGQLLSAAGETLPSAAAVTGFNTHQAAAVRRTGRHGVLTLHGGDNQLVMISSLTLTRATTAPVNTAMIAEAPTRSPSAKIYPRPLY